MVVNEEQKKIFIFIRTFFHDPKFVDIINHATHFLEIITNALLFMTEVCVQIETGN